MNYKEKQKEFRQRLKNQVKNIWVSKEIKTVEIPNHKDPDNEKSNLKIQMLQIVKGTYNKSKHGLIGSKAV